MSERLEGVFALRYARRTASKKGEHFYGYSDDCTEDYPIDYFVWVISRPDDVVVVDAGFTRAAAEERGGRDYFGDPDELLGLLGITPEDVSTLILTHLHYDHSGHVAAYQNARVWVQRAELEFWHLPLVRSRGGYPHLHTREDIELLDRLRNDGRVQLLEGDARIDDDISVHLVGGHTPGMTVVRVRRPDGVIVLASDASHFYENFEQDKPYGIVHELPAMYTAFDRLRELAGEDGVIVPGHDPQVAQRHEVLHDPRVIRLGQVAR
ncbi:N-acyl homoserine lactonase family protein [Cumulibacter manganitolerans]|uniref:N-acyl homoserine lactonase family protein n=1 Tax=Cumulibacter manganitolerans TaxID=1884992 RepID=UPI001886494F|nr:N-acyl homoserine lactonase family protein [Cumulibacter manganitolerans]